MMASAPPVPDPMGIADEERADALLLTEPDDRSCALVPQIADLSPFAGAGLASGSLQPPIPPRAFLAPVAFAGDLAQRPVVPSLEAADASARYHQRCTGVGRHGRLVDLTQVYRGMGGAGNGFSLTGRHGHMQLIAIIPHQFTCANLFGHLQMKNQRGPSRPMGKTIRSRSRLTA